MKHGSHTRVLMDWRSLHTSEEQTEVTGFTQEQRAVRDCISGIQGVILHLNNCESDNNNDTKTEKRNVGDDENGSPTCGNIVSSVFFEEKQKGMFLKSVEDGFTHLNTLKTTIHSQRHLINDCMSQ